MPALMLRVSVSTLVILGLAACAFDAQPAQLVEPTTASIPPPVAPAPPEEVDEDEPTGKSLYLRHCAGCHNDNGDGLGATILAQGKQARSFAQGGFAFGNTPEAIFDTITSGIPGSSLMQPFKSLMDDDERMLVAKYVLTLTPYKDAGAAIGSILEVGDRALFAYGKLPPIREGLPERPRGLMVGLPGGLSFEYRIDDVRLLAVRRGGFVDRTDWNERGGGYLKPLGEVVFECNGGNPLPWLNTIEGGEKPIQLELAATQIVDHGKARLEFRPKPGSGRGVKRVVETLFQPQVSSGTAFGRRIEVERESNPPSLLLSVAAVPQRLIARDLRTHIGKGQGDVASIVLMNGKRFDCVLAKYPAGVGIGAHDELTLLMSDNGASDSRKELTIVIVALEAWDQSVVERLARELWR